MMLIRKLRWVGLDEKAEQLETELERHAASATVVSTQNETEPRRQRRVDPTCINAASIAPALGDVGGDCTCSTGVRHAKQGKR
jgi:hypothetical protein